MSLKQSFDAEESEHANRNYNFDVGAELQNPGFDAAIETANFSRKWKKNYKIPEPKRRKEDPEVVSN